MRIKMTLFILLFVGVFSNIYSQNTMDVVHMLNGDEKKGKVISVNDQIIKFVHEGEDLEYELNKSDIQKIEFSSGRTEVFNENATNASNSQELKSQAPAASAEERKNKLAVLPFSIVSNNNDLTSQGMMEEVQNSAATAFRSYTNQVIVQDPVQTNAILYKNGIDEFEARKMMPQELAKILGVEYVVIGSAKIEYTGSASYGSSNSSYKKKKDDDKKSSTKGYTSTSTSTTDNYATTITLKIFNDQGSNLYDVNRKGIGTNLDKYRDTLNYLIKRSPWGSKK